MNLNRSSEVWNKQAHQGLRLEHRSGFSVDSISKDFRDSLESKLIRCQLTSHPSVHSQAKLPQASTWPGQAHLPTCLTLYYLTMLHVSAACLGNDSVSQSLPYVGVLFLHTSLLSLSCRSLGKPVSLYHRTRQNKIWDFLFLKPWTA